MAGIVREVGVRAVFCPEDNHLVMIHPFRDGNGRMARCLQCGSAHSPGPRHLLTYSRLQCRNVYALLCSLRRPGARPTERLRRHPPRHVPLQCQQSSGGRGAADAGAPSYRLP
ncbi:MAG: Fic family protein [Acidimicrobiales bacterium]